MIFRQLDSHPLRMYIEDTEERVQALSSSLHMKFYYENQYSQDQDVQEVDSLIFNDEGKYYFPSGIVSIVKDCAEKLGLPVEVIFCDSINKISEDVNVDDTIVDGITLRSYQLEAVRMSLIYKRGIIQSPTGSGKSSMMIAVGKYLLQNSAGNILMCVPTAELLNQTYGNAVKGGITENYICKFGDGNEIDTSKRVVIATIQTLYSRLKSENSSLSGWLSNLNCLILDEVQHIGSMSWYSVADKLQPEYLLGFSAEPFYGDKEHQVRDLISRGTLGPILYRVSMEYLIEHGYLSRPYVVAMKSSYNGSMYTLINWHSVNKSGIVTNKLRNSMIVKVSNTLIELGKNPLVLVQQINHGKSLALEISKNMKKVAFMTGGSTITIYSDGRETETIKDAEGITKKQFLDGKIDALIGTSVLDEGVDLPALSSVILAGGGRSKLKLLQRIGRGLRRKEVDNTTVIVDFQDNFNIVTKKHFKERKISYDNSRIPVYFADNTEMLRSIVMKNTEG